MNRLRFFDTEERGATNFEGDLVWFPPHLKVTARETSEIVLGPAVAPGTAGSAPDVLIGRFEFLSRSERGTLKLGHLDIRPPAPFRASDVQAMWQAIEASPIPLPMLHSNQGSGGHGALGRKSMSVLTWMLPAINAKCLQMIRSWPQVEAVDIVWRPLDVVGGVEDLKTTDKGAARYPAMQGSNGALSPGRSARRMHAADDWRCQTLARVVSELIRRIEIDQAAENWDLADAMRPLRAVASRASQRSRIADPPPSSWPRVGRELYALVGAALSAITPATRGHLSPPLSDLWRIYEAWISTEVARSVTAECALSGVVLGETGGEKVVVHWSLSRGASVHMLTQPAIGPERTTFGGVLRRPIYSCGGVLEPDVLLVCTPAGSNSRQSLVAIDAKKRGVGGLTDSELSEYGGKYMWNLRQKWGRGERSLDAMVVASPDSKAQEGELGRSRLHRTIARPGQNDGHFADYVRQVVRDGLDGKHEYVRFLPVR